MAKKSEKKTKKSSTSAPRRRVATAPPNPPNPPQIAPPPRNLREERRRLAAQMKAVLRRMGDVMRQAQEKFQENARLEAEIEKSEKRDFGEEIRRLEENLKAENERLRRSKILMHAAQPLASPALSATDTDASCRASPSRRNSTELKHSIAAILGAEEDVVAAPITKKTPPMRKKKKVNTDRLMMLASVCFVKEPHIMREKTESEKHREQKNHEFLDQISELFKIIAATPAPPPMEVEKSPKKRSATSSEDSKDPEAHESLAKRLKNVEDSDESTTSSSTNSEIGARQALLLGSINGRRIRMKMMN